MTREPRAREGRRGRRDHARSSTRPTRCRHRVPRHEVSTRRAASAAHALRRRVQGVQEHAGPLRRREAGVDDLDDILVGPTGPDVRQRRRRRRRQGAPRLRQDQPAAGREGRRARRGVVREGRRGVGRPAAREVLLAQFAGALQAPLVKTAGLLQALPRNFAYGLKALIDQKKRPPEPLDTQPADTQHTKS